MPLTPTAPNTPTKPAVQPPYTISPGTFNVTFVAGHPVSFGGEATQTTAFVGNVYMKLNADNRVIESLVAKTNADGTIAVWLTTSALAVAGHYAGDVTVNVCQDANCTTQLEGSSNGILYINSWSSILAVNVK